ncbi:MAG: site-2 protease family protein [Clostridiaceae bacterium]|nr:site-2 protease family protein [uncultured Agathobaculum sp.]MBS6641671.1 site-2 protease family protein [Clostridiaceae bacterium]HIX10840.1 site-2 protease family protein [Candidatus Agathobaculum pullistercoris]
MLWRSLMSGDLRSAFITLALSLPAIVLCLSIHEAAHGGAAYLLGDRTAHDSGRLTLSPLAHIDPVGFICLLLFGFGWARPVPVNISNFKNRRTGMAVTALAGPAANFVTAFIAYCLYFVVWIYGNSVFMQVLGEFLAIVASMSVGLGVFNLIPVHPLDGSRVLDAYLPFSWSLKLQRYQPVIILLFIFALWRGWLDIVMMRVSNIILGWAAQLMSMLL